VLDRHAWGTHTPGHTAHLLPATTLYVRVQTSEFRSCIVPNCGSDFSKIWNLGIGFELASVSSEDARLHCESLDLVGWTWTVLVHIYGQ
jgi:hypothetical protein